MVSKSGSLASQDSRSSWSEYLLSAAANGAQRCPTFHGDSFFRQGTPTGPTDLSRTLWPQVLTTDLAAAGKAGNQFICAVDIWWSEHLASPKAGRSKPWHSCRLTSGSVRLSDYDQQWPINKLLSGFYWPYWVEELLGSLRLRVNKLDGFYSKVAHPPESEIPDRSALRQVPHHEHKRP